MNFQTCLRAGLLAGTGALALAVSPAFAAEAAAPAADAASPETDSTGLTEIVVTATKRETNLQQTPISISVMGADDLKKRHVQSLMDLADGSVPSLRISTFEARQSALTIGIRGIVPDDANQPARDQGVAARGSAVARQVVIQRVHVLLGAHVVVRGEVGRRERRPARRAAHLHAQARELAQDGGEAVERALVLRALGGVGVRHRPRLRHVFGERVDHAVERDVILLPEGLHSG